ncbi:MULTISPECIES: formylglycine-generating enzyme family protein [unclassified Thiocapsa]|uniref:formylglycine-generating enzyme family protein n=1 Tax=unclassified Thiocapsa TaxID=2641286 RepID=UPI0035AF23C1
MDHIDGWSTERVQGLQKRFASALGKTVIFQDPPFTVKAVGGFLGFGSGAKIIQCPEMAVIPPGGLMGHLEVQQSFALGLYAVTNEEYVAFCRATGHKEPEDSRRAHHPVRHVSWFDAFDYCAWLSVGTGEEYRLPTQKEWEYACRAGTTTKYIFGDTITPKQANFGGMYYLQSKGIFPKDPNHKPRYPVGSYSGTNAETAVKRYFPNAWGLFQMHGNVSEWVADVYPGNKRLTCGGGWGAYEEDVGSDSFLELDATEAGLDIGFRVARSLKQAT